MFAVHIKSLAGHMWPAGQTLPRHDLDKRSSTQCNLRPVSLKKIPPPEVEELQKVVILTAILFPLSTKKLYDD